MGVTCERVTTTNEDDEKFVFRMQALAGAQNAQNKHTKDEVFILMGKYALYLYMCLCYVDFIYILYRKTCRSVLQYKEKKCYKCVIYTNIQQIHIIFIANVHRNVFFFFLFLFHLFPSIELVVCVEFFPLHSLLFRL